MNRGSSSAWGKKGFKAGRLAVDLCMILHASGNFLMAQFSNLKNRDFINVYNDFFFFKGIQLELPGVCKDNDRGSSWCFIILLRYFWASLVAQWQRISLPMQDWWVRSLDWTDPLEKGMATHSSILAWRIPWTEQPERLGSIGSQSQTRLRA